MSARVSMAVLCGALLVLWMAFPGPAWSDCSTIDGAYRLVFRGANVDVDPAVVSLARDGEMVLYVDEESPKESPPVFLLLYFDTDDGGTIRIQTAFGPKRAHR